VEDTTFSVDSVYDPSPDLATINGHEGAKYATVVFIGQGSQARALSYQVNFLNNTDLIGAEAEALAEFPSDATVLFTTFKSTCAHMEVRSEVLGRALSASSVGHIAGLAYQADSPHDQPEGHDEGQQAVAAGPNPPAGTPRRRPPQMGIDTGGSDHENSSENAGRRVAPSARTGGARRSITAPLLTARVRCRWLRVAPRGAHG
jgi:hypothetical protein